MLPGHSSFAPVPRGFKRGSALLQSDHEAEAVANNPPKRSSFSAASKIASQPEQNEDSSLFANYKVDENLLNTHWLFVDDPPTPAEASTAEAASPPNLPIATTRVPSIEPSGFKFASGKPCNNLGDFNRDQFRRLLGLDDPYEDAADKAKIDAATSAQSSQSLKQGFVSRQTTSNVYDDFGGFDVQSTGETVRDLSPSQSEKLTCIEMWNQVCRFTKYNTSNMSLEALSELWRKHGNPFQVTFANVEHYTYLLYTHENEFVSVGGLEQVSRCFKRAAASLDPPVKWQLFDDSWIRDKFKVLTLASCRRYTKRVGRAHAQIVRLYRNGSLTDSITNVPLPNPINLIKMLIKYVRNQKPRSNSILNKIIQGWSHTSAGDLSPDVSVVLRVEHFDRINAYLSDGAEIYKGVFSDSFIREAFEKRTIKIGSKLLIQGVLHTQVRGEPVLALSYNSISRAPRRPLGLQPKHSNVNIKDLIVGGGRVSRVEVVVLKTLPMVYRIWYKCPETSARKAVSLSEQEYIELTQDPESELAGRPRARAGAIEQASIQFTLIAIDGAVMIRNMIPDDYDQLIAQSCVPITLVNVGPRAPQVDETVGYILKPRTRFVLTNTSVNNLSNTGFIQNSFEKYPIKLVTTCFSRLEILADNEQFPPAVVNRTELARVVFCNLPALSLPEDSDDVDALNEVHINFRSPNLFLGQLCDINGVILYVGALETVYKSCFVRLFLLTTRLHLVSLKVNYKNFESRKDELHITSEIEKMERALRSFAVSVSHGEVEQRDPGVNLFVALYNVQYNGYDAQNNIVNFQGTCDQMILKRSAVLKSVQECFRDRNLMYRGNGICLSPRSSKALGDSHLEQTCKIFFNTILNNIIEVRRLVQLDSEHDSQT